MASIEEIRVTRLQKLEKLKARGIDSYPAHAKKDYDLENVVLNFTKLSKKKSLSLVGRVMSLRPQGGLVFFNLNDGSASFQGLVKKDVVGEELFDFFSSVIDIGDFVEVRGSLFLTKRNEKTIEV